MKKHHTTVPARHSKLWPIEMEAGATLRYSFTSNLPINFGLTGPQEELLHQGTDILTQTGTVRDTAAGRYILTLDNRSSLLSAKHIDLEITKETRTMLRPPFNNKLQEEIGEILMEKHFRWVGSQVRLTAARFEPDLAFNIPGNEPVAAPEKLREAARNMAEYLDGALRPQEVIMGEIPTPKEWDGKHAMQLIAVFHGELNDAKDQLTQETYTRTLDETLSFSLLIAADAARDYNKPLLDRIARGDPAN